MDTPISRAGTCCYDRPRLGCQTVDPLTGSDWLIGYWISAEGSPVALLFDLFVWDRAFHHENKRIDLTSFCFIPPLHKVVANLVGEHWIMKINLGESWYGPHHHIFDAGLACRRDRDRITVTT